MNRQQKRMQKKLNKKRGAVSPPQMNDQVIALLEQAIGFQNAGQLESAATIYNQVLQVDPNNTFANHLLGVVHLNKGEAETAVQLIQTALKIDPANPEMLFNFANALKAGGRAADAEKTLLQALSLKPDFPAANSALGKWLVEAEKYAAAEPYLTKSLELNPADSDALNNYGVLLMKDGKIDEAEIFFRRALELFPNAIPALNNLGHLLMIEDRYSEAEETYRHAIAIAPENIESQTNLGSALQHLERIEEAEACFRYALELQPDDVKARAALAHAQLSGGFYLQALDTYDEAIAIEPQNTGLKVKRALALPIIPASLEDIENSRAKLLDNVEQLMTGGGQLKDPVREAGITGFYLAYHNLNDVACVKKIAEMYLTLCPSLAWQSEHCTRERQGGKYRIGFLSYHLYDHTIGKLFRGIIEHLDPDLFDITVFRTSRRTDPIADAIEKAANKVVYLQQSLEQSRQAVANEELDLLYYPDVGMNDFTYFLAFARLAPVQVTSWGHPMSTGIPNMDYFISSQDLESENGADHYSETLVRLAHPPTYYYRPAVPPVSDNPDRHNLPADKKIYLCPQTLFKIHPKFDPILGDILRGDPDALLVMIAGRFKSKEQLLLNRFAKVFPDAVDRVVFMPRMQMNDFLQLIRAADVVLDPVYFSGGNSSVETFAMGVPIVTWPDGFLRDRVTYAFYKRMGGDELIATSASEYVSLANQLASDSEFRARMSQQIEECSGRLFENMECVRDLEQFLVAAIEAQRSGNPRVQWGKS